jgi:putative ABC transport system substrate-binding protein
MEAFPALMEEVVKQRLDLIVTTSTPGALAAKKATTAIPIVVHYMADPVGTGLVSSLAHPGGNLTGMSSQLGEGIPAKWLEILSEVVPLLSEVAVLSNPKNPFWRRIEQQIDSAAKAKGLKTAVIDVQDPNHLETVLLQARKQAQAVIVLPDPMFLERGDQVIAAMAKTRMPAIYGWAGFVAAGGLISYSTDPAEGWEHAATYVDKILRGANAGDLPVAQPTKFQLMVNLKTAKVLGLSIPRSVLVRADEVIR